MERHTCLAGLTITCVIAVILFAGFTIFSGNVFKDATNVQRNPSKFDHKRVLITGAAGFIGFHLASTLITTGMNSVVGLDNFNDYYDVQLKIDRAHQLHKLGVKFHFGDVCDSKLLDDLFAQNNFTHVVHLAAQAGVRFSLKHPLAYVHSNVECQVVLLEVLKHYPNTRLIFASSSSVYGKESPVPFRIEANTDFPGNMYAATKKTDELLGFHYCQFYHLKVVGLRFFTVYGPWGRPDMAIYKFAESIMNGKDVPLYEASDNQSLGRDFTYVDDVIKGILSAFDYIPSTCGEYFNLGLGSPVSVSSMVKILEEELNVTAKIRPEPLPLTELLKTWADIDHSIKYLSFHPMTDLREGIRRFVTWYKDYRKIREDENRGVLRSASLQWFKENQGQTIARTLVQKSYAAANKILQSNNRFGVNQLSKPSFADGKISQNTSKPVHADGIVCKMDCPRHALCMLQEGGGQVCQCQTGFFSNGKFCIPRLHKSYPRELEWEYLAQSYSMHNITEMKSDSEMVFFQGMDSPGSDYLVADVYKGNHKKLVEACQLDPLCLAINTNGWMKKKVLPKEKWIKWSAIAKEGLFVYDINYCTVSNEKCPERSHCTRLAPGDFKCVCDEPYHMVLNECVLSLGDSYMPRLSSKDKINSTKKDQGNKK